MLMPVVVAACRDRLTRRRRATVAARALKRRGDLARATGGKEARGDWRGRIDDPHSRSTRSRSRAGGRAHARMLPCRRGNTSQKMCGTAISPQPAATSTIVRGRLTWPEHTHFATADRDSGPRPHGGRLGCDAQQGVRSRHYDHSNRGGGGSCYRLNGRTLLRLSTGALAPARCRAVTHPHIAAADSARPDRELTHTFAREVVREGEADVPLGSGPEAGRSSSQ